MRSVAAFVLLLSSPLFFLTGVAQLSQGRESPAVIYMVASLGALVFWRVWRDSEVETEEWVSEQEASQFPWKDTDGDDTRAVSGDDFSG